MNAIPTVWNLGQLKSAGLPGRAYSASAAGTQLALIFDAFKHDLQTEREPLEAVRHARISVPLKPAGGRCIALGFWIDVRGHIALKGLSSAVVAIEVNGVCRAAAEAVPAGARKKSREIDFFHSWDFVRIPAAQAASKPAALDLRIALIARRNESKHLVTAQIDSLDIEALAF